MYFQATDTSPYYAVCNIKINAKFGTSILQQMKKFTVEIRWAIRYIFVYIAWVFLEKGMGVYSTNIASYPNYSMGFYALALLLYILAINDKKKQIFHNSMSWKQGCVSGIYLSIGIGILMPFCQAIVHKFIAPEFFPNMIQYAVSKNYMQPAAAAEYYSLYTYIFQSLFFSLSIGVVFSAIAALILRTHNNPQP